MKIQNNTKCENSSNKDSHVKVPRNLKHKPVIACNYNNYSGVVDDAKYLSVGHAQYDENDVSIKIFRHTGKKWSRQSEEVPIDRVADMTLMLLVAIKKACIEEDAEPTILNEKMVTDELRFLKEKLNDDWTRNRIKKSLNEIKDILNSTNFSNFLS